MNNTLNEKMNDLKGTLHALWDRMRKTENEGFDEEDMDLDYERNSEDDLPLSFAREESPGVKYYSTENNPMSVGAEKVEAGGIDSFGEDDSIDSESEITPGH